MRKGLATLRRDTRGASLVEYVVLCGAIALVALLGFRVFGTSVNVKPRAQAGCVATLDARCAEPTGGAPGQAATTASASAAISAQSAEGRSDGGSAVQRGPGYWVGGVGRGFVLAGRDAFKGAAVLVASATPLGLAYSAITGTPNAAVSAVKTVGKLALWATPPMQLVTAFGGPDPIGDMTKGVSAQIRDAWKRDPAETIGRGAFEVAGIFVPGKLVQGTAKIAEAAEAAQAATKLEEVAEAARAAEAATRAAEAARVVEAETALDATRTAEATRAAEVAPETSALDAELSAIAREHPNLHCAECARDIVGALQRARQPGTYVRVETRDPILKGVAGRTDIARGEVIGGTGHDAVETGGKIFDNIHPEGLTREQWLNTLQVRTRGGDVVSLGEYLKQGGGTLKEYPIPMPKP